MAEELKAGATLELVHPGEYEIHALHGDVVAWEDGEAPQILKSAPKARGGSVGTFKTEGRLNVQALTPALVAVTDLEAQRISAQKAASSAAAQPEPAKKAAGRTAAGPAQAPSAPKAQKARPSSAKARGAKTNKPATSQVEAKATGTDPAKRLSAVKKR